MPSASLTFVSASRSSVRISYDGSGWYIPANEPEHSSGWSTVTSTDTRQVQQKTVTQVVYDVAGCTTTWHWSFSGGNGGSSSVKTGTITIGGMTAGSRGSVTGRLSATRSAKQKKEVYTLLSMESGAIGMNRVREQHIALLVVRIQVLRLILQYFIQNQLSFHGVVAQLLIKLFRCLVGFQLISGIPQLLE